MNPRVLVVGAVESTATTLAALIRHKLDVVGILGHQPRDISSVSGWCDLESKADLFKVPFHGFDKINDDTPFNWAKKLNPDLIFAIGFSQILHERWLRLPRLGCIGFHPTLLPRGRGRAPIAWIILEERIGAASFFLMGEGADDGPIFVQEPFDVEENDDASSVSAKINMAIDKALDRWLPNLNHGIWNPIPQDECLASYYGIRKPIDGMIEWSDSAENIDRLIKATTHPHPGAFSYIDGTKVAIWKSTIEKELRIRGVAGRVLMVRGESALIQCGDGLLWLDATDLARPLRVGDKLGYAVQHEIQKLWAAVESMRNA